MIGPSRIECERAVLGLALHDPVAYRAVIARWRLGDDHFRETAEERRVVHRAIDRGVALRGEELAVELAGAESIAATPPAMVLRAMEVSVGAAVGQGHAGYYARALREHEALRATQDAAFALARASSDLDDARRAVASAADAIAAAVIEPAPVTLGRLLRDWYARLGDAYERRRTPHVPLGDFRVLDACIGGLLGGECLLLVGPTSLGKSSLGRCIVASMARAGTPCGIVSLEDAVDTWIGRFVADESEIESMRLRQAVLNGVGEWTRVTEAAGRLANLPISIVRVAAPTTDAALDAMRVVIAEGARIVLVDYVQALHDGDPRGRHVELSRALARMKALASERNVAIVVESQMSREAIKLGGPRPPSWSPKDSGDLENAAEAVAILWCPLLAEHEERGHVEDCIVLHVTKAKNGRRGVVPLHWNARRLRFDERTARID